MIQHHSEVRAVNSVQAVFPVEQFLRGRLVVMRQQILKDRQGQLISCLNISRGSYSLGKFRECFLQFGVEAVTLHIEHNLYELIKRQFAFVGEVLRLFPVTVDVLRYMGNGGIEGIHCVRLAFWHDGQYLLPDLSFT